MTKLAIIDLGSNSARMSTYNVEDNGSFSETGSYRIMVKLSEGMTGDMLLKQQPILRTITALLKFKEIIIKEGIENVIAVATAAVRKAKNSAEFLSDVKDAVGIDIEVIDGEREAYYDMLAAKYALNCEKGLICDIGGGSIELIGIGGSISGAVSIPYGSRSFTEMFFQNGETTDAYEKAKAFMNEQLSPLHWLGEYKNTPIIGIGGCLRAISKFDLSDNSSDKIKQHIISQARLKSLYITLKDASPLERRQMPGIGTERADIIMGGALPLMCIIENTLPPDIIVADIGVRDGILFNFIINRHQ